MTRPRVWASLAGLGRGGPWVCLSRGMEHSCPLSDPRAQVMYLGCLTPKPAPLPDRCVLVSGLD